MLAEKKDADEATPLTTAQPLPPPRHTSLWAATALLATFSTTSSNVAYPFVYGQLGAVGGPLLGIGLQAFACALAILTVRLALKLQCGTYSELGRALGGKWGAIAVRLVQQFNNALFMPVALVYSAEALRDLVLSATGCDGAPNDESCSWWHCNINSLLMVVSLAWPVLLLARDVSELSWNAFVSIILIVVQTAILCTAASTSPAGGDSPAPPYTALAMFGPGETPTAWYTVFSALGMFLYSFAPLFIAVEVMAEMTEPEKMPLALVLSLIFNLSIYVVTGLVVDFHWGGTMPNPITRLVTGTPSVVANSILFYCTFLDFAIVGAVLNRELQQLWMPKFDRSCSLRALPTWLLLTLPSLFFALLLSLTVPRLDSLIGLLTALCVPGAMFIAVPAMLLRLRWRHAATTDTLPPDEWADAHGLSRADAGMAAVRALSEGWDTALLIGATAGVVLLIAVLAQTIFSVAVETDYRGAFFCKVVGADTAEIDH